MDTYFVHGMFDLSWWAIVLVALAFTHVTIIAVAIFLHRHQREIAAALRHEAQAAA